VRPWERYWFAPVAAARPYLLQKSLLALLALDCWLHLAPRGAWYGAGGFNVAHFALLDALLPRPTPALYVGVVLLAGLLAGSMVLLRPEPVASAVLFALYTYGWAMSMQDSYQHHYLLSLLLACLVFFPPATSRALFGEVGTGEVTTLPPPRTTTAWAYVLLAVTCAVVYAYAAIAKMDPAFRQGAVLARLAGGSETFAALHARFLAWGGDPARFWEAVALSAIAAQLASAAGYLVCVHRDSYRSPIARALCTLWMAAPLAFHVGVERIEGLAIEWFGDYMIVIAVLVFAPEPLVRAAGTALSLPWRWLQSVWGGLGREEEDTTDERMVSIALAMIITLCLAWLGHEVDLPGAMGALTLVGLLLGVATLGYARRGAPTRTRPWLGASLATTLLLLWALSSSPARFDFYRQAAGDYRRRGLPCESREELSLCERALAAYEKANRYAPLGRDRRTREAEMRRLVERHRPAIPPASP